MSLLRAVLKVASKDRQVRRMLINEIRKTAEGEGEEAPKAKGKGRSGPPPGFDKYVKAVWNGGSKKVPNPNPKGRQKDVTFNTAMKDETFRKKIMKDFAKWMKAQKKSEKGESKKKKTRSVEELRKSGKPLMDGMSKTMKSLKTELGKDKPDPKALRALGKEYYKLTSKLEKMSEDVSKLLKSRGKDEESDKALAELQDLGKQLFTKAMKIDELALKDDSQEFGAAWEDAGGNPDYSYQKDINRFWDVPW